MSPIYRPKQRSAGHDGKLSEFEQLLKESFSIYRNKWKLILPLAVILMVNSLVLAGGNYFVFKAIGISASAKSIAALIFWVLLLGFTILVYSVCQIMLLTALKEKKEGIKQLYKQAKPMAFSFAKLYVYVRFLIFMWMLPFFAAMVALLVKHGQPFGSDAEIITTIMPSLPLLIPGLVFVFFYIFSSFIFVYQDEGIKESVKMSKAMVTRHFWTLLGKYALLLLLNLAVYFIINQLIGYLPGDAAKQLVTRLIDSLIAPVYVIFGYLLYHEIKSIEK